MAERLVSVLKLSVRDVATLRVDNSGQRGSLRVVCDGCDVLGGSKMKLRYKVKVAVNSLMIAFGLYVLQADAVGDNRYYATVLIAWSLFNISRD